MEVELTRIQRLELAIFGKVYLEDIENPHYSWKLPVYAFKCYKHGIVKDYPHNYNTFKGGIAIIHKGLVQILKCPICKSEAKRIGRLHNRG